MADYLEGRLDPAGERAFESEVLDSDDLARALYSEVNLRSGLEEAGRAARLRGVVLGRGTSWIRRAWPVALPLAAALALLVLVPRMLEDRRDASSLRGRDARPRGLMPAGPVSSYPRRFVWTRDPGAARYRFELYDKDWRPLYEAVTTDTVMLLPAEWQNVSPEGGQWKVVPVDSSGFERGPSLPTRFSVESR
jgi:hypothetical protein